MQGVLDAGLLLLELGLGRRTDLDDGHPPGELRESLLQLLSVVVRGRLFDLGAHLGAPPLDVGPLSGSVDDRRVVPIDNHPLRTPKVLQGHVLELDSQVLADRLAPRQDRDVFEHRLAAVAETGRLDGARLKGPAELVHDEHRERFPLDVFGYDEQGLAAAGHRLEERNHVPDVRDLFLVNQDVGILHEHLHPLRVGDEVGREVPAVELHPLDDLEGGLEPLGLLDRDHPLLADLVHRIGDDLADRRVAVRRHGANLGDLVAAPHLAAVLGHPVDHRRHGVIDPPLELHGIRASRHELEPFVEDRLGEHGRGRRSVPGHLRGLGGHLLDHLNPEVLEPLFHLDRLGDRDAVLRGRRRTPALVDQDVATARSHRRSHGLG